MLCTPLPNMNAIKAPQMNFSSGKFDPNELTKNGSLKIVFPSKEEDEESKENASSK